MLARLSELLLLISAPALLALAGIALGAGLVALLRHMKKGADAEHSLERGLDEALAVVSEARAAGPSVVLDEVSVGLGALDKYLKAHDLGPLPPNAAELVGAKLKG